MIERAQVNMGARVEIQLPDGTQVEGDVVEIGGRLLGPEGVDPAWARVAIGDKIVLVSEAQIVGLVGVADG